ncbi:transcription cofactor vestigial-like protein 3 [Acipenser oxyrinchus oxyrinchus]|uniref:Transcription cofactor vestigial-like protein 3 n=1 Tax=Acipenser oxyrinchus oxyrinchus TaxID=40147 RepID=A0AAD8DJR5_ACIOX|nr:transcription cofactor vestigial-like protein 3 [Acipenser oxyrinchus oxyrinchus]
MSCLEVMYHHQPYGAHQYLPATSAAAAAAAAYKAAYYHHHHHQNQQKLAAFSKMHESLGPPATSKEEEEEEEAMKEQPAEAEYLSSRCILFTYFQGEIGDVVDEHFNRALSQASSFSLEPSALKSQKTMSSPLWKEGATLSGSQFPASLWNTSYQPQAPPCLSGVHPEFPGAAAGAFHSSDPPSWASHALHQPAMPPVPAVSDSWHYPLASQASPPYTHIHDIYSHMHPHSHPHHHPHHSHILHHPHSSHLDPRYSPLLVPTVRTARNPTPQGDIPKTDPASDTTATQLWAGAFHSTVDVGFDTGLQHQDKGKGSTWF